MIYDDDCPRIGSNEQHYIARRRAEDAGFHSLIYALAKFWDMKLEQIRQEYGNHYRLDEFEAVRFLNWLGELCKDDSDTSPGHAIF